MSLFSPATRYLCHLVTITDFRPGYGKFDVPDIDPTLCTHGFYGFAKLSNITWELTPYDPW